MQGKSSKDKGARGEREFAKLLTMFGFSASRQGRQFFVPEGREHQDITHDVEGFHFEVKTVRKLDVPGAMRQARKEKPDLTPIIAWKGNRQPWRCVLDAHDLIDLLAQLRDLRDALTTKEAKNDSD